ncbi:MAG: hypothetical protein ACPGN3_08720 [Opitutales bacterium]
MIKLVTLTSTLIAAAGIASAQSTTPVSIGTWAEIGNQSNTTYGATGSTGYALSFTGTDGGASGGQSQFDSGVTLSDGQSLVASYTVSNIVFADSSTQSMAFRAGFEYNTGSALESKLHYMFHTGSSQTNFRIGGDESGTIFSRGSILENVGNLSGANPLVTGNTSEFELTLTLIGQNSVDPTIFDYQASVERDGVSLTSSTFTRNTNTWTSLYIYENDSDLGVDGDSFTISDVSVAVTAIPEASHGAFLISLASVGFIAYRRRAKKA